MPNEELRERNVRNVLEQAAACFKEFGIEATTLTLIAKRAGVSARSIQRYFGTKDNLIRNVTLVMLEEPYIELREYVDSEEFDKKTGFEQVIDILLLRARFASNDPHAVNSLTEFEVYFSKHGYNQQAAYYSYVKERLKKSFLKGIADGSICSDTYEETALNFLTLAYKGLLQRISIIYTSKEIEEQIPPQKYVDAFIQIASVTLQPKIDENDAKGQRS
ncbi:MAG: TetR/AcrR family transcriptional regulator [Oscillospiraceae bacterium]